MTFVIFAILALLSLATLVTARHPPWGRPEPHARPRAVSSLATTCVLGLAIAGFGNGRPVLPSLIFIVQLALIGLSLVLVVSGRAGPGATAVGPS